MRHGNESLGIRDLAFVENVVIQLPHYLGHLRSEAIILKDGTPLNKGYRD